MQDIHTVKEEDILILRLVRAFQRIKDREARRSVILFAEHVAEESESGEADHQDQPRARES